MRASILAAGLLSVILTACGGGGGDVTPPPAATQKVAFIGNSLTYVPITPELGWSHAGGMAASDAAHDYAHLVAAALGATNVSIVNFADLERNPQDAINKTDLNTPVAVQIAANTKDIDAGTVLVVQLGDNVPSDRIPDFAAAYGALLDAASARAKLACVSTFWEHVPKDQIIKAACEAHGGRYVYIGDIRTMPGNRDLLDGPQYANAAVNGHPHDFSMAKIADRVNSALACVSTCSPCDEPCRGNQ